MLVEPVRTHLYEIWLKYEYQSFPQYTNVFGRFFSNHGNVDLEELDMASETKYSATAHFISSEISFNY